MAYDGRPYRRNVGVALFDPRGRVLICRRIGDDGPEVIAPGHEWQLPQGGVDPGEDIEAAARRELFEETGVGSAVALGRMDGEVTYDWPPYHGPPHRLGRWRGQSQTWLAFRFEGAESEIDLTGAAAGETSSAAPTSASSDGEGLEHPAPCFTALLRRSASFEARFRSHLRMRRHVIGIGVRKSATRV